MKKLISVGLIGVVMVSVSGCATIMTGTDQSFTVNTEKEVTGARCVLSDTKGRTWHISDSPGSINVKRGAGPMSITCKKDGFKPVTIEVEETVVGAVFGNILLGGLIGVAVDIMSGASQKYPEQVIVWMEPEEWASVEEHNSWLAEKEAYDKKKQEKQEQSSEISDEAEFSS